MEASTVEAPVAVPGGNVEEPAGDANENPAPVPPSEPIEIQLARLYAENKYLREEVAKTYVEIGDRENKLRESAQLIFEQQCQLDENFVFTYGEAIDAKLYAPDNPADIMEVKNLLSWEKIQRKVVEKKHATLKENIKGLSEEYAGFTNSIKEYLEKEGGGEYLSSSSSFKERFEQVTKPMKDKLDKKVEQIVQLKTTAKETSQKVEQLLKLVTSTPPFKKGVEPEFKIPIGPAPKAKPKSNLVQEEEVSIQPPAKVDGEAVKVATATEPPKPPVQVDEDEEAALKLLPIPARKRVAPPPPIISLDEDEDDEADEDEDDEAEDVDIENESPPMSPRPIPTNSDDSDDSEISEEDDEDMDIPMPNLIPAAPLPVAALSSSPSPPVEKAIKRKQYRKRATEDNINITHDFAKETKRPRMFHCKCNKKYGTRRCLERHIVYAQKERKFICNYCDSRFVYQCFLKLHLQTKHGVTAVGKSQAAKIAQRRRSSVIIAQKVKPSRKEPVQNGNLKGKKTRRPRRRVNQAAPEIINDKNSPHHQSSYGSKATGYACSCGLKSARQPDLHQHIKDARRNSRLI